MYSQHNEEQLILTHFGKKRDGRFLDIGAFDGRDNSNTHLLALCGWSGLCIEADPQPFHRLEKRYAYNPKVETVNAALVKDAGIGTVRFWSSNGDEVGTVSPTHKETWEKVGTKFTPIMVPAVDWTKVLVMADPEYDLLSLDIEGVSAELLMITPHSLLHRLRMIIVEHDGAIGNLMLFLGGFGFSLLHRDGENLVVGK